MPPRKDSLPLPAEDQRNLTRMTSRKIKVGNRYIVLPPEGHGEVWTGSAR
jgi:hypothetical protein